MSTIVRSATGRCLLMLQLQGGRPSHRLLNETSKGIVAVLNFETEYQRSVHTTSTCHSSQNMFDNQPRSWLFVSGATAGAYGSQVNLNLDLKYKLAGEQLQKLIANMNTRKMDMNLEKLLSDHARLQELESTRKDIEQQKEKAARELSLLKSQEQAEDTEWQRILGSLKTMKRKLTDIQKEVWPLEEQVMLTALKLPNDLHSSTPIDQDFVTLKEKQRNSGVNKDAKSHVDIGKKHRLIKFSNVGPKAYYLHGMLAQAETSVSNTLLHSLQKHHSYRLMSGPEFFKTPILEGCGRDVWDTSQVLTMQHVSPIIEPMNHLAGVSPMTFVAYIARTCLGNNSLPLRMVACGRAYQNSDLPGLFGAAQSTQVGVFSITNAEEVDSEFDAVLDVMWNHLEPLGFSLRACQLGAANLRPEERRRVEVQMFSPALDQFIPIAHVSDLGDYVSRRLMVSHNLNHGDYRQASVAHMISGTALNITSMLAIWMEHSNHTQEVFSLRSLSRETEL